MAIKVNNSDDNLRTLSNNKNNGAITFSSSLCEKIPKKKITLSITQEDSEKVKIFALKNHTTVSDLLHEWIEEKCKDD